MAESDYVEVMTTFTDFKMESITGQEFDFKGFEGQVVLVINVASY